MNEFECNDGKGNCIPLEYANDGEDDCADGSDEGTIGKKIPCGSAIMSRQKMSRDTKNFWTHLGVLH